MNRPSQPQHGDFGREFWQASAAVPGELGDLSAGQLDDMNFRLLADNIPTLCWIANGDGYIVWYNRRWHEYCGTTPEEMEGWGWQSVHDPDLLPQVMERWTRSVATGEPFEMIFPLRGADGIFRPFLTRIQPVRDATGEVVRWFGVNTEISAQVAAEKAFRDSDERLRMATDAASIGTWDFDPPSGRLQWDDRCKQLFGLSPGAKVDYEVFIAGLHPDDRAATDAAVQAALEPAGPGRYDVEYRTVGLEDGIERWIAASGRAFFSDTPAGLAATRFVGTVVDISAHKLAEESIRRTEERFRLASRATNDAIWDWDLVDNHVRWNEALETVFGHLPEQVEPTGEWWLAQIHPDDKDRVAHSIHAVIDGAEHRWEDEYRFRTADGGYRTVLDRGFVIRDDRGKAIRMIGAMLDQTERLRTQQELSEATRRLETLNRTGEALAGELDLERVVQMVTDAGVELTGARFGAFFYNITNADGERLLLYTLSGANRSDFEDFGMPRPTPVFKPTFEGQGPVRSDDILTDPRYGHNSPHKGMPEGHLPVRSYLALPVIGRSGEVIGGLFFGHPEPSQFTERHEELMTGIAAQAAVAIDNARLYRSLNIELSERAKVEAALRELNETLEQRVSDEIARRSEAEDALRQAQKMETLGQLTGGIAHDFNNLLQVVTGNIDLLKRQLPDDAARMKRAAENALAGAARAATLTQRLLAFSRRQPLSPRPTDINRLVATMSELLHRTLGETVEVETVLAPRVWPIEVDPNQLENAIINLAVNARDAMPKGGKLTIETQNTHLDHQYTAQHPEISPGQYVVICISDTGTGMEAETLAKAIEPFFTTKEVGRGTGLGLSMVYGFVKQSGGHFRIYSEPGEGTTVKLYLPRLVGALPEEDDDDVIAASTGNGDETILVCEDDDDVRAYSVQVLRELGYRVLEAHDGPSAMRLIEQKGESIDLLFSDVVLPGGMSGADIDREAKKLRPGLKTLFTTGYARNAIFHHGRLDPGVELITKPFGYSDLALRIREMLDGVAASKRR